MRKLLLIIVILVIAVAAYYLGQRAGKSELPAPPEQSVSENAADNSRALCLLL